MAGGFRGGTAKLYYESVWTDGTDIPASPTVVEIKQAIDVSGSFTKGQANLNRRGSNWNKRTGGLKDAGITFQYRAKRGTDAVKTVLQNAWLNDTILLIYVMDDDFATVGANGWRIPGIVLDFSFDHPLEDGAVFNVQIDPGDAFDASDDEIDPTFVTIV